jgi:hypothetical protein
MPVVQGQVFLQIALVFGLIGVLGLVLRWTFHRDAPRPPADATAQELRPDSTHGTKPEASPPTGSAAENSAKRSGKRKSKARQEASGAGAASVPATAAPATPVTPAALGSGPAKDSGDRPGSPGAGVRSGEREDYGLLKVATEVATAEEATKVRRVLTAAGIRNTNAVTGDGRHRVLVFGDELIRARRVTGGSQGAGGSTGGAGTN